MVVRSAVARDHVEQVLWNSRRQRLCRLQQKQGGLSFCHPGLCHSCHVVSSFRCQYLLLLLLMLYPCSAVSVCCSCCCCILVSLVCIPQETSSPRACGPSAVTVWLLLSPEVLGPPHSPEVLGPPHRPEMVGPPHSLARAQCSVTARWFFIYDFRSACAHAQCLVACQVAAQPRKCCTWSRAGTQLRPEATLTPMPVKSRSCGDAQ